MKPMLIRCVMVTGLTFGCSAVFAQHSASPLIVVEDLGGSPTAPYYDALAPVEQPPSPGQSSMPPRGYSEADMLPVHSPRLTPGIVDKHRIEAPGLTPLFLIGDDDRSRAWLSQRLPMLQRSAAVGLVVNVETKNALQSLRALAPGLELVPAAGDDLAHRLGLSHYPVLITSTGVEQ